MHGTRNTILIRPKNTPCVCRPDISIKESFIGDIGGGGSALRSVIEVATDKLIIPELVSK